jgi:hypothetical protein
MQFRKLTLLVAAFCVIALTFSACGKDDQPAKEEAKPKGVLQEISKEALGVVTIDDEFSEARDLIEGAGFVVASYGDFPSQEVNKKGRVLVYTDKGGKKSGGVIYLKKTGGIVAQSWHWFFENMVPDSVKNVELNNDGLWDMQITGSKGEVEEFTQDESFTLFARDRSDWIAMNGTSSPPVSGKFGMWKCFDGDTTTAWKASFAGGEAFVEFFTPFGSADGILTIHTLKTGQPGTCVISADGKKVDEIELKPVAGRQTFQLNDNARKAATIRLVFGSVHGGGDVVEVGELSLK